MPIQINYLDNGTGIEIIASGIVTCEEIIKANKEIYNEWNIYKQQYQIIDCNSPVRCATMRFRPWKSFIMAMKPSKMPIYIVIFSNCCPWVTFSGRVNVSNGHLYILGMINFT